MINFLPHFLIIICFLFVVQADDTNIKIAQAAMEQVGVTTGYSPGYSRLDYPGGDIPPEQGVCADVIIRAFRKVGIDFQKEVHEDMKKHFKEYPKLWRMSRPDPNIDHRRVPNLMKYFQRRGKSIRLDSDYKPGDIVAWQLERGLFHIGIVSMDTVGGTERRYMIHNIGEGVKKEDMLNDFRIIGHYRW